jgi:ribose 5-phosphate isomerase A
VSNDIYKLQAAAKAIDFVESGMTLGLGTGSTAAKFVDLLGDKVRHGLDVQCVATSEATRVQALRLGIPLTTLDERGELDLAIDGADEIDPRLRLIKGGGGAHLREKIVAMAADRFVIIADSSKKVDKLGKFPLPIEIVQFGVRATMEMIEMVAQDVGVFGELALRRNATGAPFLTDNGNYIVDCAFGEIGDPEDLSDVLEMVPGVVEHGLFIDIADAVIIAGPGGLEILTRDPR